MFNSQLSQRDGLDSPGEYIDHVHFDHHPVAVIGTLMAWIVVRTITLKKLISSMAIIPYMLPAWAIGLAWLVVFRGLFGGQMGFFQQLTG